MRGRHHQPARVRADRERGSATLEFIAVSVLVLIPLFYLIATLSVLQRGAYAVSGAARDAARVFVTASNDGQARSLGGQAARIVYDDYGFAGGSVGLSCLDGACLAPQSRVKATATLDVPLPLIPDFLRSSVPSSVHLESSHIGTVDRFR